MNYEKHYRMMITGMVQGIGFRPFAAGLAEALGISGSVRNENGKVTADLFCSEEKLTEYIRLLRLRAPESAVIDNIKTEPVKGDSYCKNKKEFVIEKSRSTGSTASDTGERILLTPDLPVCKKCLEELYDPSDRRYMYPFISCTACGPRYSIIEDIPYDRENTVMKSFRMCGACEAEYKDRHSRRRHAQTISCHDCGPQLTCFVPGDRSTKEKRYEKKEALQYGKDILKRGGIAAVKDIGGFHLVCSPFNENTVKVLRMIKNREKKPFAVMFKDVNQVKKYCLCDENEEKLLSGPARPIVLLYNKKSSFASGGRQSPLAFEVSGDSLYTGAMIPGNPLQHLLLDEMNVLVMTSANDSGVPMIIDNDRMEEWIREKAGICEEHGVPLVMLSHMRKIVTPLDDSVMAVVNKRTFVNRRARGIVPEPVELFRYGPDEISSSGSPVIFAAGGDLKSVFCILKDNSAYLSQHFGDAEDLTTMAEYKRQYFRMKHLFRAEPDIFVCDRHPLYASSLHAALLAEKNGKRLVKIQHHHAHILSVMAENDLRGRVLGIAFDGTGYGDDGNIWGSEFLLCEGSKFKRAGHLRPVKLTGGDEGARNALNMLMCFFHSFKNGRKMFERWMNTGVYKKIIEKPCESSELFNAYETVTRAVDMNINTVISTSMGRLFDAVSALLGICFRNTYEGECAIELETRAAGYFPYTETVGSALIRQDTGSDFNQLSADMQPVFEGLLSGLEKNMPPGALAAGFIMQIAEMTVDMAEKIIHANGVDMPVALSGGTWQNRLLFGCVADTLADRGVKVYSNSRVPVNDGGIALGQAFGARLMLENERRDKDVCSSSRKSCENK